MARRLISGSLPVVRILVALDSDALLQQGDLQVAGEALAEIAADHQLVVVHSSGPEVAPGSSWDCETRFPIGIWSRSSPRWWSAAMSPSPEPSAIAQLRSLRLLVGRGGGRDLLERRRRPGRGRSCRRPAGDRGDGRLEPLRLAAGPAPRCRHARPADRWACPCGGAGGGRPTLHRGHRPPSRDRVSLRSGGDGYAGSR